MSGETWVYRETVAWTRVVVVGRGAAGPDGKAPADGSRAPALVRALAAVGQEGGGRLRPGAVGAAALLALGLGVARVAAARGGLRALPRGGDRGRAMADGSRAALPAGTAALPERAT